jgi:hypothetical protein
VHGGSAIARAGATRYSQVTHYYFDDCIYYTPVFSNRTLGKYLLREDIVDIRTGNKVRQTYNGRPFSAIPLAGGRKFVALAYEPGSVGAAAPSLPPQHLELQVRAMEGKVQELLNSRSYKLGRLLSSPYRWLKTRLRAPVQKVRTGLR